MEAFIRLIAFTSKSRELYYKKIKQAKVQAQMERNNEATMRKENKNGKES